MKTLAENVTNVWGEKGKEWLSQLPATIAALAKQWGLTDLKPVNHMSYNYVALATHQSNIPVALKISCDTQLILNEYKALRHFAGHGAVKVIDANNAHNALLLEQAIPGRSLQRANLTTIEGKIKIYADVIKTLASCQAQNKDYPHVSQWCAAIDRVHTQRIDQYLIACAHKLRIFLLNSTEREHFCHGDLHLNNIIQHQDSWLTIDPKGIIGETAFEAAAFNLISTIDMQDTVIAQKKIVAQLTQLSCALNLHYERLLAWVFLRAIICAQWFIEDNGDPDDMLFLAGCMYPLLQSCA